MSSFIHEVYQTDFMDTEYLPFLEQHLPPNSNYADYIDKADFRMLRAILTYYVRQERFQEGLWIEATVNGVFSQILLKIKDKDSDSFIDVDVGGDELTDQLYNTVY